MNFSFYKYQGTGNDFILADNRKGTIKLNTKQVAFLCSRKWGIGADGLLLLQNKKGYDFEMKYYNADGKTSTFCGNGSRCIVAFAKKIKAIRKNTTTFMAADGAHEATLLSSSNKNSRVNVKMRDIEAIETGKQGNIISGKKGAYYLVNSGSPHYVVFGHTFKGANIIPEAKQVRYSGLFGTGGVNVNFAEKTKRGIFVRTYERGVEDETLSCGTGVTASALSAAMVGMASSQKHCTVETPGGKLTVRFHKEANHAFAHVWLEGEATFIYQGQIEI
jgi:diaminopimelate epimerase